MYYLKMLENLIEDNKGIVSTKMVSQIGIPRIYLSNYISKGRLKRIERGIYLSTDKIDDKMYCFQMRFNNSIFSHEAALYLHNYLENPPEQQIVTVKTGMNTKSLIKCGAKVYSIKPDLYALGVTEVATACGRVVQAYNVERSICDIIRSRSKINMEIIVKVLKKYNDSGKRDLSLLMEYALKLRVSRILSNYLDVL